MNNNKRISIETFEQIDKCFGVILRIPGLFMIDSCWRNKLDAEAQSPLQHFVQYFALLNGLLVLLLPLSKLKRYYLHVINCLLLLASLYLTYTLTYCDSSPKLLTSGFLIYLSNEQVQHLLSFFEQNEQFKFSLTLLHILFDFCAASLLQASRRMLVFNAFVYFNLIVFHYLQIFTNLLRITSYLSCIMFCWSFVGYSLKHASISASEIKMCMLTLRNQDPALLARQAFKKIFVPVHFLIFWSITFSVKLYLQTLLVEPIEQLDWMQIMFRSISNISITPITIVSTSVTVTYLSCFVLTVFKFYIWGSLSNAMEPGLVDNRSHNGLEEGITTLMLTSLTYITNMNENARMAVMFIISLVVISSLLHSMLEISEPAILSLNNNHNTNRIHHLKILLLCAFLFGFPVYITYILMQMFPINFWTTVVFCTCILVSIKVLDLFFVHCLFWWDSCQNEPLEYLDEMVYYTRSITKVLEFIISLSVLVVSLWEACNDHMSVVHGVILLLHYYFNVYQRLNDGIQSYRLRRDANKIVNALVFADSQRIASYNDICSICFREMSTDKKAKVIATKCNHLFHRLCIKKWLCFHNRCPLCAAPISENKLEDKKIT